MSEAQRSSDMSDMGVGKSYSDVSVLALADAQRILAENTPAQVGLIFEVAARQIACSYATPEGKKRWRAVAKHFGHVAQVWLESEPGRGLEASEADEGDPKTPDEVGDAGEGAGAQE